MNKFRLWGRTEFVRNSATLLSANVISQAVALLIYPVISRLFSPDDFGIYSLFLSIASVLAVISTGRYEQAVILTDNRPKALAVFQLSVLVNFCLFLLLFPIFSLGRTPISSLFNSTELSSWLPLIPLLVLLSGLWQSVNCWMVRFNLFKKVASYNLIQSIVNSSLKCFFGFIGWLRSGLIFSTLIGQFSALSFSLVQLRKEWHDFFRLDKSVIKSVGKQYANFPKYEMPQALINNLSGNLPILLLSAYFQMMEIGLFSLAITMSMRPINLFTDSVDQVLYKEFVDRKRKNMSLLPVAASFCKKMSLVCIPFFILLFFFAEPLFAFLFGEEWRTAGSFLKYLLPWLFFVMLTASLSFMPKIYNRQRTAMIIEIIYVVLRLAALCIGIVCHNFLLAIALFAFVSAAVVAGQLVWFFVLMRHDESK